MYTCYTCFKQFRKPYTFCPHCGAPVVSAPLEANHLRPGTVLADRYLVGQAVGAGGFGIIYKAWDTKLETVIAIKEFFSSRIMSRSPGSPGINVTGKSWDEFTYRKERFLAEARTMAQFGTHRSIPNVFEFFEENGTAYIVMEFLTGISLSRFLKENQKQIDLDFALFIANETGNALSALHQAGIIHRDVAPDNIFICSDGGIRIKLLDLGAAKLADRTDDAIDIVLKPGYSPPEQYDNSSNISTCADIYALGATLYTVLTGRKPDESTNREVEDTLVPPDQLNPGIPERVSNAVMKAMALDPDYRFRSVDEFLRAINGDRKVLPPAREKKRRNTRRRLRIAAAILLPVCLVLGTLTFRALRSRAQMLDDAAISVWVRAEEGSAGADAMDAVISDFQEKYPNITVERTAIPADEYAQRLQNAWDAGNMPTLFESEGTGETVLSTAHDLDAVLRSRQAKRCLFLDQYHSFYTDQKKLPLAIEVPVAYVITAGNTSLSYRSDYFSSLEDFGQTSIAVDPDALPMLLQNLAFDADKTAAAGQFLNNRNNSCAVYLSSTASMDAVRRTLTSCEKKAVYYDADRIACRFVYEWSVSEGSTAENAAAERLLSMMLDSDYQTMLMISLNSDGRIPVNKTAFFSKISQNNCQPIAKIYKKFAFFQ